jgi:hypothetical protein
MSDTPTRRPPHKTPLTPLTRIAKDHCLKITAILFDSPIAAFFRVPVDPKKDDCGDYFDVIKTPMDLSTVRDKLTKDQYQGIEEWKSDIQLIWKNARTYNGQESIIVLMGTELEGLFAQLCEIIPSDEWDLWTYKVQKRQTKLYQLLRANPSATRRI